MKASLLKYLMCPQCASDFTLHVDQIATPGGEVLEGSLSCPACKLSYPITRGIPRILPRETSSDQLETAAAFGYEWTHFSQIEDTYEQEFLDWIAPIEKAFFKGKLVLDAGCGKGRHAALSGIFGSTDVVGADISDAVEAAYANTSHLPNVHIIQADINHLPVRDCFDYVYSIGVLHHMPNPRRGFLSAVSRLKSGGRVSAWVYGEEGNWWITHLVTPFRTNVTSRFPAAITNALSFCIAVPMQLALKIVYRPVNQFLPVLSRFLFYNDYLYSISGFSFRENYSTVFDHLIAPTAFYIKRDDFLDWFKEAGLAEVNTSWRNKNSWRGTAVKPPLVT